MKYILVIIFLSLIICTGCVTLNPYSYDTSSNITYQNPLIIINYFNGTTQLFSRRLKKNLIKQLEEENQDANIFTYKSNIYEEDSESSYNIFTGRYKSESKSKTEVDNIVYVLINDQISKNNNDVILSISPTYTYLTEHYQSSTYEVSIVGVNPEEYITEIKYTIDIGSPLGPSMFTKKFAKLLLRRLKEDKII